MPSVILFDVPWGQQKPPYGSRINKAHPLMQGIAGALLCNEGASGPYDQLTGQRQDNAVGTWQVGAYGPYYKSNWAGSVDESTNWNFSTGSWTVAALINLSGTQSASDNASMLGRSRYIDESNNQGWAIGSNNNSQNFRYILLANGPNFFYNLVGSTTRTNGDWLLAMTTDGTTRRGYCGKLGAGNLVLDASTIAQPYAASQTTNGLDCSTNLACVPGLYYGLGWNVRWHSRKSSRYTTILIVLWNRVKLGFLLQMPFRLQTGGFTPEHIFKQENHYGTTDNEIISR